MGQKVNPIGLRLGVNKTWSSRWYADPREYADLLHEDLRIRKIVKELPENNKAKQKPFSEFFVSSSLKFSRSYDRCRIY